MSEEAGADAASESGDGEMNVWEENPYLPTLRVGPTIPHYYGDYVRQIFMLAAAVMLIFPPFFIGTAPDVLPFEIGGAVIFAILGALTNPVRQLSLIADAIAAAVGILCYELLALQAYASGSTFAFMQREAIAIALLFALYFAIKTLRNMAFGTIGKRSRRGIIDATD